MTRTIEDYLDELVRAMAPMSSRNPRAARELLAETEAHLRDRADELASSGLAPAAAEAMAVEQFGPVDALVDAERDRLTPPLRVLARQTVMTGLLLGGIGAVAVGLSGLVNGLIYHIGGPYAVIDVAPGRVLSASDCARWLALDPHASSCRAAAVHDWVHEVIGYRVALGVLGVGALVLWAVARRRVRSRYTPYRLMLPSTVTDTIAVTAFGAAAAYTLGAAVDLMFIAHGRGTGQLLSATLVSLAAVGVFGGRLLHDLRHPQSG